MVSIDDVASFARVSPTTVSHTLSGKRVVSPEIQARVRDAMTALNYVPSRAARNLANGRSRLIALIVPDISNDFFGELAKGAEEAAIASQYNVVLCNSGFDHARERLYLETIQSRAVDGIVYAAGAPPTDHELEQILGDIPVVLVDEEIPGSLAPTFVSDNETGGKLAANHLIELGHTKAAIIRAAGLRSSELRSRGFERAWTDRGYPAPFIVDGQFTFEGGWTAGAQLVNLITSGEISCVFATNDLTAIGAIRRFDESGIVVPKEVSVIGFDDSAAARYCGPQLTTVRQQVRELGYRATAALISSLEATEPTLADARDVLPVELVVRASTAQVKRES